MRVARFLHKLLDKSIHKKQVSVLSEVVESALETKKLTLTALGRGIKNTSQERSNIRKVDRLLGNKKILDKGIEIYQSICSWLFHGIERPLIIVDAVKLPSADLYALRASSPTGGRCHTVYELLYPKAKEGNPTLHRKFLKHLKEILPTGCRPIIVTDAGFHNPWFKSVLALGWDCIGRIRGLKIYRHLNKKEYNRCSSLWEKAQYKAQFLGEVTLSKKNPLNCYFYQFKRKIKGRINRKGRDYEMYSRSSREPWLLASSLREGYEPLQIIKMYERRMKIEESFRDMKSSRYGLGLDKVVVRRKNRYGVLLLIAMLANFIGCLMGKVMESKSLHYIFQANSIKSRRVLSYFFLGCQGFRKGYQMTYEEILSALESVKMEFAVPA
jgi:hypothetical protein